MSEKKTVRRSSFIALGIICIVLVACLVGGFGYFMLSIDDKDNTISSLTSQISTKDSQISQLNTQISDQNSTISSLNSQISQLNSYITNAAANLQHSKFWFSQYGPARSSEEGLGTFSSGENSTLVPYVGYLIIQIEPTNNNFVKALYNSAGTSFVYQVFTNANGTAIIPVLPTNSIEISVGNLTIGANYTARITYYY